MTRYLDLKAIGYGVAVFTLGWLALAVSATVAANSAPLLARVAWAVVQAGVFVVPGIAGYVSALRASTRPILHGSLAGSIGIAVLACIAAGFFPQYPAWGIPLVVAIFALVAALGAIFGKHRRDKAGP
jgi:uncharacterized membrane protein HdeD (DUF308 family)